MSKIRKICVYCGSGPGTDPAFVEAARAFGKILAKNGIGLVYGGGAIGIMGELSRAVLDNGGEVDRHHPGIPDGARARTAIAHNGLIVTRDMHERKRKMFEMADAFVALPGGVGTLEEIVEQMTWVQLGRHKKPILLANIQGLLGAALRAARSHEEAGIHPRRSQLRPAGRRQGRRHPADAAKSGGRSAGDAKELTAAEVDKL